MNFVVLYSFRAPNIPTSHRYVKCVECGDKINIALIVQQIPSKSEMEEVAKNREQ
ncbi:MAG: hypothetical protein EZS28_029665, partial [Streblomastix strix]